MALAILFLSSSENLLYISTHSIKENQNIRNRL